MELHIPKLREGSYFPSLLEPRRRSEKALLSVIQQSYTELHINRRRVHPPGGRSDQGPGLRDTIFILRRADGKHHHDGAHIIASTGLIPSHLHQMFDLH